MKDITLYVYLFVLSTVITTAIIRDKQDEGRIDVLQHQLDSAKNQADSLRFHTMMLDMPDTAYIIQDFNGRGHCVLKLVYGRVADPGGSLFDARSINVPCDCKMPVNHTPPVRSKEYYDYLRNLRDNYYKQIGEITITDSIRLK